MKSLQGCRRGPDSCYETTPIGLFTFLVHAEKVQSDGPGEDCHEGDGSQVEERRCHLMLRHKTVNKGRNNKEKLKTNEFCSLFNLQGEEEGFPFFAPKVRHDAGGCGGEHQGHQDAGLTQTSERK